MRGDETFQLNRDQSTYILTKTKHRYLGEDDMVRFENVYGRVEREVVLAASEC